MPPYKRFSIFTTFFSTVASSRFLKRSLLVALSLLIALLAICQPGITSASFRERSGNLKGNIAQQLEITSQDTTRQAAIRAYQEGKLLIQQATTDSVQQALIKWEKAAQLLHEIGDQGREAIVLTSIGTLHFDLKQYEQALKPLQKALTISRSSNNRILEEATLSNIGDVYATWKQPEQALDSYKQALIIARELRNEPRQLILLRNIGKLHKSLEQKEQAVESFQQALVIARRVKDRPLEKETLFELGKAHFSLRQFEEALEQFQQALVISRELKNRVDEADLLHRIGNTYFLFLKQDKEALKYYQQSLVIAKELKAPEVERDLLLSIKHIYENLGAAGQTQGNHEQAIEYYRQFLAVAKDLGEQDQGKNATILKNIGDSYLGLGQNAQALEAFQQALGITKNINDYIKEIENLHKIGIAYNVLGEYEQALEKYEEALALARKHQERGWQETILIGIAGINAGVIRDYTQALKQLEEALVIARELHSPSSEGNILNAIGSVFSFQGKHKEALQKYEQALVIAKESRERLVESCTRHNIAGVYNDQKQYPQALEQYQQVLSIARELGNPELKAAVLYSIAFLHNDQGDFTQALDDINTAIPILENTRGSITSQNLRTCYSAKSQYYYDLKISLLMQTGQEIKAFETNERTRARGLLELLAEANTDIDKAIDPQQAKEKRELEQQIDALEKRLSRQQAPEQASDTSRTLTKLYRDYQERKKAICTNNPKYGALQCPQPLTLRQIQQTVLDDQTVLLQYSLGEKRSYLWVVSKTGALKSYTLPSHKVIEQAATKFRDFLTNPGTKTLPPTQQVPDRGSLADAAHELTRLILQPAAEQLAGKRLVIVADGKLHFIPFAALTVPGTPKGSYVPLIEQHQEIVHLPSASTIAILRDTVLKRSKPAPKTLAILADPVFVDDDRLTGKPTASTNLDLRGELERSTLKQAESRGLSFKRLKHSEQEAQAILALVPNASEKTAVFGFDASYDWATSPQLSQYRYIHFATHGFFDGTDPKASSIVLAQFDRNRQPRRFLLRIPDLFNLNLAAELVTLSACETGLGEEVRGEGIIGMTRGLMYAGAARVGISLWNVDDRVTSELMQQFYQEMLHPTQPRSAAVALGDAQRKLWQDGKSPYYWAGFVLQGEWRR